MHNGETATQATGVLDLNRKIEEAVAIEIAECIDGVQLGGEREPLLEARDAQRRVGPERHARERGPRELRTGGGDVKDKGGGEKASHQHTHCTHAGKMSLRKWIRPSGSKRVVGVRTMDHCVRARY